MELTSLHCDEARDKQSGTHEGRWLLIVEPRAKQASPSRAGVRLHATSAGEEPLVASVLLVTKKNPRTVELRSSCSFQRPWPQHISSRCQAVNSPRFGRLSVPPPGICNCQSTAARCILALFGYGGTDITSHSPKLKLIRPTRGSKQLLPKMTLAQIKILNEVTYVEQYSLQNTMQQQSSWSPSPSTAIQPY